MEPGKMALQMISFQRTLFESTFSAMCTVQDQTEQMTNTFLKQMNWMPEETRKSINDSVEMYKKAREDFKKSVDQGFEKFEEIFQAKV